MPPAKQPLGRADPNVVAVLPTHTAPDSLSLKPAPKPRKRKADTSSAADASGAAPAAPAKKAKKAKADPFADLDVAGVALPGDADGSVPVFDTCDMARRRLRAALRRDGATNAGLARALSAASGRNVTGTGLATFLAKKGPEAGNTSGAFYAAYVLFEKLRLKQGKPKTDTRVEMERRHPGGFDTTHAVTRVWLARDESVALDKYGSLQISGGRNGFRQY